jgi:hypothetical protein
VVLALPARLLNHRVTAMTTTPEPPPASLTSWMLAGLEDAPRSAAWLHALRHRSAGEALPALILRLERLNALALEPEVRLQLMRLYKRPVLSACAALPRPPPLAVEAGTECGLTAEQRLDRAMRLNLNQLFQELDRKRYRCAAATEDNRYWVLRNLFKFLRRQIRYALLMRRPCPANTWQDLHDLFVYLVIRGNIQLDRPVAEAPLDDDFDAETEYKRLLLMGYAQQCGVTGQAALGMLPRLTDWSRNSRLSDPGAHLGLFRLLMVEVSHDRPVRMNDGSLRDGFRGWVLLPADAFMDFVDSAGCCDWTHSRQRT